MLSLKVNAPAAPACVMPLAPSTVLSKDVVPVEVMAIEAPVPSPTSVVDPTAPLNVVLPVTARTKSWPPSTVLEKSRFPLVFVVMVEPPLSVTAPLMSMSPDVVVRLSPKLIPAEPDVRLMPPPLF